MTDEHKFLTQILADPADDTPRLVYADWLDEHGTPKRRARAEFVRVQCKRARLVASPPDPECGSVSDRWCPVCGDCTCADPERGLSDLGCPLHDPDSLHGADRGEVERQCAALRNREYALLKKWGAGWVPRAGRRMAGRGRAVVDLSTVDARGDGFALSYRFERGFVAEAAVEADWPLGAGLFDCMTPTVRDLLRGCPVALTRFTVRGRSPAVLVHTGPEPAGGWKLRIVAGDEAEGEEAVDALNVVYTERPVLVREAPRLIVATLGEMEFERFTDDNFDPVEWGGSDYS